MFRLRLSLSLFAIVCLPLAVPAQSIEPTDTLRIDTDLVNLNVSVFNLRASQGTQVLQPKDFAVLENGAAQEISFFASNEAPFDLVLLLDLSGSAADKIGLIRKSSKRFVDAARPADRLAIVTFTAEVHVVSTLTSDHDMLKKAIDAIEKPQGGTNFWDALRFVLEHVLGQSRADKRRSAVVVMTDGVDNALPGVFGDGSATSFDELLEIVRRFDTLVLPIYLDTEKEANFHGTPKSAYVLARQQLAALAAESGNQVYQARKLKDLEGIYPRVIQDLGRVYSLGYRPTNSARDGSWRAVTVQLIGHSDLGVRARHGYYAGKQ
jgi:VWFA-related protein